MQTKTNSAINSYLSFRIGNEIFAANVENVLNILEMTRITKMPKSPSYMMGVINHRGNVLPIIDSRLKFDIEASEITATTCIIVFEIERDNTIVNIGAIVDAVKEVLEIDIKDIMQVPSLGKYNSTDFLKGMYKTEEGFVMILDIEKVLDSEEILDIQKIASQLEPTVTDEVKS
jgi:purine-binding chemotaxis protein CheW